MTAWQSAVVRDPVFDRQPGRILVVDDDPVVRVLLREMLLTKGHDVTEAENAAEAEVNLRQGLWDLVLLDRRLPDSDGLLLLQRIRDHHDCPVIVLSVMDDEHDRTLGLGLGAHDYIAKPFSAAELLLRIQNLLMTRRATSPSSPGAPFEHGPFVLSETTRRLMVDGSTHQLTSAEARLMAVFLAHAGEVLSRNFLTRNICHRDWSHNDRSIDVLVARLRKRIECDPKTPEWIVTIHGAGYLFNAAVADSTS